MKENVPPRHYLTPAMYNEHGVVDVRRSMMPEAMYYHPPRMATSEDHDDSSTPSYESLARENGNMREQLKEKDMVVSSLQQRVNYLEKQINELRQLPTGKISHIPIE
jgi:chromosome segregation ATPase